MKCKAIQCRREAVPQHDFCGTCLALGPYKGNDPFSFEAQRIYAQEQATKAVEPSMAQKYPQYYKDVGYLSEVDVYAIHKLFDIQDPSGCIQHASKKLLLSGVRTGGKSVYKDITEARDTINRWLQLNPETV